MLTTIPQSHTRGSPLTMLGWTLDKRWLCLDGGTQQQQQQRQWSNSSEKKPLHPPQKPGPARRHTLGLHTREREGEQLPSSSGTMAFADPELPIWAAAPDLAGPGDPAGNAFVSTMLVSTWRYMGRLYTYTRTHRAHIHARPICKGAHAATVHDTGTALTPLRPGPPLGGFHGPSWEEAAPSNTTTSPNHHPQSGLPGFTVASHATPPPPPCRSDLESIWGPWPLTLGWLMLKVPGRLKPPILGESSRLKQAPLSTPISNRVMFPS